MGHFSIDFGRRRRDVRRNFVVGEPTFLAIFQRNEGLRVVVKIPLHNCSAQFVSVLDAEGMVYSETVGALADLARQDIVCSPATTVLPPGVAGELRAVFGVPPITQAYTKLLARVQGGAVLICGRWGKARLPIPSAYVDIRNLAEVAARV